MGHELKRRLRSLKRRIRKLGAGVCICEKPFVVCEIAGEKYDPAKIPRCPAHPDEPRHLVVLIDC